MANRFWVNTSGGTWDSSTTGNWSTTSGGASGASVPGSADTAIFDANSGSNTITTNYSPTLTALQLTSGPFAGTLTLGGNLTLVASSSGALTLQGGTFNANGHNISCWSVSATGTATRAIQMGSGTWTLTGNNGTIWNLASTGLTLTASTSTIAITDTGSTQKSFQLAGLTHNAFTIPSGTGIVNFSTTGTPVTIAGTFTVTGPVTLNFQNNRQFNFSVMPVLTSSSGNVITITSNSAGIQTKLQYTGSGILQYNYMSFKDVNVLNALIWYVGANSTNTSNNSYLIFTNGPATGTGVGMLSLL